MSKKTFYITTPIYFPSDNLHIGHAYCSVMADTLARFKRMQGYDTMFLTGTDEHGLKIAQNAKKAGVTPKEFVDEIVKNTYDLWDIMDVSYDKFIRTTDDYHVKTIQNIFTKLYEQDDIYKGAYEGLYCVPCESFWSEKQLIDGKCPDCGREVIKTVEEGYFFRLSKYQDRIYKLLTENTEFLQPESRRKEMINNFLKPGLEDLFVTRKMDWGIPVPFDDEYVIYVWIDALPNYISALGYSSDDESLFKKYWPADLHLVGKEIVRFHTIIWPAILMALDLPLPKKVLGHGWLTFGGEKMSKSRGNVVDPHLLSQRYGVDAIRYYLLRMINFGSDGSFTNESLINTINSDLANDLGNLVSRTGAMAEQYFQGILPSQRQAGDFDDELISLAVATQQKVEGYLEDVQFSYALADIWKLISRTNKYIDETMPWALAKDETKKDRLAAVIYNLAESIRIISILISPFLPSTSEKIQNLFDTDNQDVFKWEDANQWGLLPDNTSVSKGDIIFPRLKVEQELEALNKISAENPEKKKKAEKKVENVATTSEITFDEFMKVNLIVAQITNCEKVEGADKLLKLTLNDGSDKERIVVSGIAPWYSAQDLLNKQIILVANLKPAKLRGVESNGMILAADGVNSEVKVIFVDGLPNGAKVR